jgi:hypothetical protein
MPRSQEIVAPTPHIVLTFPICRRCGAKMRLARIEPHPRRLQSEVCVYDCECGAIEMKSVDHTN